MAFLIILLIVAFLARRIFVFVGPGEAGILYRPLSTGTVIDFVYPEKLHIVNPINTMYIYNVREQVVNHEFFVLSIAGMPIKLSIAVRFKPQYNTLGLLHRDIGPDYVYTVILPHIESVLRRNIGRRTAEEIYTNKEGVLTDILVLAAFEVGKNYVEAKDILIRSLELPETVRQAIEDKLVQEQLFRSYEFRIQAATEEARRRKIEAQGISDYQAIITQTLTPSLLTWEGIQATHELAKSQNAKIVIFGQGDASLPIIMGGGLAR